MGNVAAGRRSGSIPVVLVISRFKDNYTVSVINRNVMIRIICQELQVPRIIYTVSVRRNNIRNKERETVYSGLLRMVIRDGVLVQ